ncbi:hypothetical protein Gpo141_00009580 [Globisporangium polare]
MAVTLTSQVSVRVSRRSFALWWLTLLLLHVITGVFFGAAAIFYWHLEGTYFDYCLSYYGITTGAHWYSTIAILLGAVALLHALAIIKMVGASVRYRSFAFSSSKKRQRTGLKAHKNQQRKYRTTRFSSVASWLKRPVWSIRLYHFLCDRKGVFGVEGKHFHAILFTRELVETILQTIQAYHMSIYLSRMWLNRFYVGMLVLNCWSTALVHHLYKKNEAKKRLLCLVCDCALDLVASVAIPIAILATYYVSYVSTGSLVDMFGTYDEAMFMQAVNELQMLFVVSWRDLGTRLVFSLGLIIAMSDVKELLIGVYITNQVNPLSVTVPGTKPKAIAGPSYEDLLAPNNVSVVPEGLARTELVQATVEESATAKKLNHLLTTLTHASLVVLGVVILGVHVYAESHVDLIQCPFQVRPWGKAKHVCSLVLLNCYASGISGAKDEVDAQWRVVDLEATVRIQVRHCEAFEMPPMLQNFSQLQDIKVYNTTIASWNDDAAITTAHHPHLAMLFFVRMNMTDGELPPGLLSADFPVTITDISFSVTNLRSLPSDLDTKWANAAALNFENGAFTAVPEALLRMKPIFLSFYGNPIRELPSELFETETIMFLHVGNSLVTSLPANVAFNSNASSLWYLYASNTSLSYFPAWLDGMVTAALVSDRMSLFASDTPYCSQLEQIQAGSASEFVISQSDLLIPPSMLMDASPDNLDVLQKSVNCSADDAAAFFPLSLEDRKNRLVV